ncbi:MAG: hypothetical protein LKCHEGNO_02961 [Burkholderiaceae bacterium]|nr:hypothetical protein [Burkholderiaceae bacterium]
MLGIAAAASAKPYSALSCLKLPASICSISTTFCVAPAIMSRSRAHSAMKALRAPSLNQLASLVLRICATSSRTRSLDSSCITCLSWRECTAFSADSRTVQRSNSAESACARSSISLTLLPLLPRSPRSSRSCSVSWRRWSPSRLAACARSASMPSTAMRPITAARCGINWADSASSSAGRRLACTAASSPATRAASASRADSGNTRSRSTASVCATPSHWCCTCSSTSWRELSGSANVSILLSTTKRSSARPSRCSRQISRSDLVTPVSAPRMNTVACADGSSPSVSSGSAPIAFSPGVSITTSPRLSSGCG